MGFPLTAFQSTKTPWKGGKIFPALFPGEPFPCLPGEGSPKALPLGAGGVFVVLGLLFDYAGGDQGANGMADGAGIL